MARMASQAKGGYYPTPPAEMALVLNRLTVKNGSKVNMLDPCAGEGTALKQAADYFKSLGAEVKTYGVELEETRAELAKEKLDRVVKGGYENLRASNEVFSFIWLNPPYDWARNGQRMELNFLRDLTAPGKYLQPGGVLGFCIPQYVLKDCAQILAFRFDKLTVYRFTDDNYSNFKQVVVFGHRMAKKNDPDRVREIKEYLIKLGTKGPDVLPPLDFEDEISFEVPESAGEVNLFRGSILDPEEIARDIENAPGWQDFENLLMPPNVRDTAKLKSPVLPLKPTHMATAIAAGAVGGNMTDHILVGLTAKKVDKSTQFEEKDNGTLERHISVEKYVTKVRIFSCHPGKEGVYTLE